MTTTNQTFEGRPAITVTTATTRAASHWLSERERGRIERMAARAAMEG